MSDIYKINVSMLKSYENDFKTELNSFNSKTYTTFSSSYLKNCSNPYVYRMSNELQALYDKIKKGYQSIDKWWSSYNDNVESLENYLSDNGSIGAISESSIRNSASQLPNLKKYNFKFSGIVPASIVGASYNTAFLNNIVSSSVDPFSSLYSDYEVSEVNASASVVGWAKNIGSNIKNFFVLTGAKISSFGETVVSKASDVIEDVGNFFDETKAYITNKAESLWDKATEWWNDATQKVGNWFAEVGTDISNGAKSLWADVTGWWSDVEDWWNNDALPWIQNATNAVWDVIKSVGATVAVFVQSLVEGLLQFVEAIVDFSVMATAGVASIFTGIYDGIQAVNGSKTGEEWSSVTKKMWNSTMGFVSNKYASGWFDSLYQDTVYGQWLVENAYGYDTVRSIGTGIGYVAGIVILTIVTFGVGGAAAAGGSSAASAASAAAATSATEFAVVAGAAGMGRKTQDVWADGGNLEEGLVAGAATGIWEGAQFYLGSKIGAPGGFGDKLAGKVVGESASAVTNKLVGATSRVILDGIDGGLEGGVIPAIDTIYKDGYYDEKGNYIEFSDDQNFFERYSELFDDNGGWKTVLTQASIGSATSLFSEVVDLKKYFKDSKTTSSININEQDLQLKIDRYNELVDIKNSNEYLSYIDNAKKGYAQQLKIEFEGIEKELATLEGELAMVEGLTTKSNVSKQELKKMLSNESNLKQEILQSINGIDNEYLKARKAYMELNQKLHYDMDYVKGGADVKAQIINKATNFDNIKSGNRVVCKGWSELYRELLLELGFDENDVRINTVGQHRWVEIDIDGRYIIQADATDAINKSIDLSASKGGYATSGFICIDNSSGNWTGVRPKSIVESGNYQSLLTSNDQWLFEIDKQLGYANNNGYFADELTKTINLFSDTEMGKTLSDQNKKIEMLFDIDLPSNMDGYEVFAYYRKISNNLFGIEGNPITLNTLYLNTVDGIEPVNIMISDNIVQLYSTSLGKKRFYNLQEALQFFNSLK